MTRLSRTVALVGLMGAGKTSVGRRLAESLGVEFVDADAEIEMAAGHSIPEIFSVFGEEEFRRGEERVIARLLRGPPRVLATGGGAFMSGATRRAIRDSALSVWLRADLDTLVERVSARANRPLLQDRDQRAALKALIEERYPVYAEADLVIDSSEGPLERTVESVRRAVRRRLAG